MPCPQPPSLSFQNGDPTAARHGWRTEAVPGAWLVGWVVSFGGGQQSSLQASTIQQPCASGSTSSRVRSAMTLTASRRLGRRRAPGRSGTRSTSPAGRRGLRGVEGGAPPAAPAALLDVRVRPESEGSGLIGVGQNLNPSTAPRCSPCLEAPWTLPGPRGQPSECPTEGACKAWNKWATHVVMVWNEAAREATKVRLTRERGATQSPPHTWLAEMAERVLGLRPSSLAAWHPRTLPSCPFRPLPPPPP